MERRDPAADDNPTKADDDGSFVGGTDDPLELVRDGRGGGEEGGATRQPEVSSSLLSSVATPPAEHVMETWLYPVVSGHDPAADNVLRAPTVMGSLGTITTTESSEGKLPTTEVMFKDPISSEKKRASGGSSSRQGSVKHKITEKRRRCKTAKVFRTLQQLVPGCDHKCNEELTLDQTIQYIRWLQQQVQSVDTSWQAPPASATAAAAHPVIQTSPTAAVAMPMPPAVTFRPGVVPMVPYPRYHALTMPVSAPAAPLHPPVQEGDSAAAPDAATGHHAQCSVVSTEQQQHQHKN